jgi:hypothetical protein
MTPRDLGAREIRSRYGLASLTLLRLLDDLDLRIGTTAVMKGSTRASRDRLLAASKR